MLARSSSPSTTQGAIGGRSKSQKYTDDVPATSPNTTHATPTRLTAARLARASPGASDELIALSAGCSVRGVRQALKSLTAATPFDKIPVAQRRSAARRACGPALAALASDPNTSVRDAAARNPLLVPPLRRLLSTDKEPAVRETSRRRRALAPADADPSVVAQRREAFGYGHVLHTPKFLPGPPAPTNVWTARRTVEMAQHNANAAEGAAKDPATPAALLRRLCVDGAASAAEHPNCPPDALAFMSKHQRVGFSDRIRAACNPNCPPMVLSHLSKLPSSESDSSEVRTVVASNPSCPVEDLKRLSRSTDDDIRAAAAANPTLPPRLLTRLARDPNPNIAGAVAEHPGCPPAILDALTHEHQWQMVQLAVARHPAASPQTLERLAKWAAQIPLEDRGHDYRLVEIYDGHPFETVLEETLATNPSTPETVLANLASHPDTHIEGAAKTNLASR